MQLGISSLGYIIEFGLSGKYDNLIDLQLAASESCLNFAEENGIDLIELVLDPPEMFESDGRQKFIDLVNSYSLKKQVHGPFIDVNLCSHNKIISNASIDAYIEALKLCKEINAKIMTIHPGLANFLISSIRDLNKIRLKESIQKLLDFVNESEICICLENMPQKAHIMTGNDDIEEVFRIIDKDNLFFTYDTSHFYTCNGDVEKLWSRFHKIIMNVHIVDNFSKETDTHPPLGSGKVNFKEIFKIMRNNHYQGPIVIELSSVEELQQSIDYIKQF
jgi:sugar phosphate isomerase/epimerase